jgi:hypothetical protein
MNKRRVGPPAAGRQTARRVGQPRRKKREESFMPVEITGAWFRTGKGIGGRIVLGWFAPGLKPRPPKEWRRVDPVEERNPRAQPGIIPQNARDGAAVAVPQGGAAPRDSPPTLSFQNPD